MGLLRAAAGRPGRLLGVFGLCLLLSGGGCVLLESLGIVSTGPAFGHRNHGEKEELECVNCHSTYAKADAAGMPKRKVCILCHEGVDEEKPEEKKIVKLFPEPVSWKRVTALPEDVIFSHKVHHEGKVACEECHKGIGQSERVTASLRVEMAGCVECHARQPLSEEASVAGKVQEGKPGAFTAKRASRESVVANDCAVCHREVRKETAPPSHALGWKKLHGQAARHGGGKTANQCTLCHTEAGCSSCHREEAPASHTAFWKDRGHGVAAGFDRSSCSACHQADACDRCHRETEPRSHTGSWGGTRNRHCLSCHGSAGEQRPCLTCHAGARHETAPPRPANAQHAGATEAQCRSCHAIIVMQHPDNGDNCGVCH